MVLRARLSAAGLRTDCRGVQPSALRSDEPSRQLTPTGLAARKVCALLLPVGVRQGNPYVALFSGRFGRSESMPAM